MKQAALCWHGYVECLCLNHFSTNMIASARVHFDCAHPKKKQKEKVWREIEW